MFHTEKTRRDICPSAKVYQKKKAKAGLFLTGITFSSKISAAATTRLVTMHPAHPLRAKPADPERGELKSAETVPLNQTKPYKT